MIKDPKSRLIALCCLLLLTSCAGTNNSFSSKEFGKRKYLKGRYVQLKSTEKERPAEIKNDLLSEEIQETRDEGAVLLEKPVSDKTHHAQQKTSSKSTHHKSTRVTRTEAEKIDQWASMAERYSSPKRQLHVSIAESQEETPRTHWGAIAGLVCGILGIIGLFLVPGVGLLTIPALIFGSVAKTSIKAYPERFKGLGMAQAAFVLGIIGVGLIVLAIILVIIYLSDISFNG
ncbi:MAG: DUF4190 domain-containing protein [Flavobacteriales bacterium]|nr:DUF4190 domain-containing protein [Flavobacteriales bacterium]